MSNAPRTDVLKARFSTESNDDLSGAYGEAIDLCESLERELDEMTKQRDRVLLASQRAERELAQAREDALEDAAQEVETNYRHSDNDQGYIGDTDDAYNLGIKDSADSVRCLKNNAAQAAQNAAGQELPAVNSASLQADAKDAHLSHAMQGDPARGALPLSAMPVSDSAQQPAPAAPVADPQETGSAAGKCADDSHPAESASVLVPKFMRDRLERAIEEAIHPKGMTTGMGMARVSAADIQRLLAVIDKFAAAPASGPSERDWRWAANRLGEMLSENGPRGYYEFSPEQWLAWSSEQLRLRRGE